MRLRPRVIAVCCFYAVMFAYAATNACQTLRLHRSDPGWLAPRLGRPVVARGDEGTGVAAGDEVSAINGVPVASFPPSSLYSFAPGTPYSLTVRRGGEEVRLSLRARPLPLDEWLTSILHGTFRLRGDSSEVLRLDAALQRCLAKDNSARFREAADAQRGLISALRARPPEAFLPNEAETVILEK